MSAAAPRVLTGRVAAVTGAGRGIGRAIALDLAAAGATVVLTSRTAADLQETARLIGERGGEYRVVAGDITDSAFVGRLFEGIERDHSRLDILVNSAGVSRFAPIAEVDPDSLRATIESNTIAPYACMRLAIDIMRRSGDDGVIVNIGSVEAHWTAHGESGAYPASKFALRALTMAISKQLKKEKSGIRVSMVNPGGTDTLMINRTGKPRPELLRPEDVATAVMHVVLAPPNVHVFDTVVVSKGGLFW
ncbi:SDR family oxidoreductase [Agromyces bauzanensis]